jgi:excisionase family DNA binding protein
MPSTDRLHDIRHTALLMGVSPWTVRRLINRGQLRGVRRGRRVLVSASNPNMCDARRKVGEIQRSETTAKGDKR